MASLRSDVRKLSFDVLSRYNDESIHSLPRSKSDSPALPNEAASPKRKKKRKNSKKLKPPPDETLVAVDDQKVVNGDVSYSCTVTTVAELRQRNLLANGGNSVEVVSAESGIGKKEEDSRDEGAVNHTNDRGTVCSGVENGRRLEKDGTIDWNKVIAEEEINYMLPVDKSPINYFMDEMYAGNSLRSTTTTGNEKERERVYDTIFRLPWRCELLINIGVFVCFDSFLSILTIMPTRIVLTLWRLVRTRQFKMPSSADLSDFGCFVVLISGVTMLQQADISLIYHMIRGQSVIKLYVVYNVLEIFDKLFQSFGGDVMQALFNTADGLAGSTPENVQFWLWRFISDEFLAIASSIIHSFILLAQAIALSTCIVAHNNALFAMLVSNNFAEIKSNVFKRYSKDNVRSLVYFDSIERFHMSAFILFVLAQNILEAEGPWLENFVSNVLVVFICEILIDVIKHSFIAKFNDIKPVAFSEFLEDLSKQTLNIQTENGKKGLTFIPLAPACVVIRVLRPVYAAHLPQSPLPWRLFWVLVLSGMTFVMLASLKLMVGLGLTKHAKWYLKRCERRKKLHSD